MGININFDEDLAKPKPATLKQTANGIEPFEYPYWEMLGLVLGLSTGLVVNTPLWVPVPLAFGLVMLANIAKSLRKIRTKSRPK